MGDFFHDYSRIQVFEESQPPNAELLASLIYLQLI